MAFLKKKNKKKKKTHTHKIVYTVFLYKLININTDADKLIMNEHSYKIENEQHGLFLTHNY